MQNDLQDGNKDAPEIASKVLEFFKENEQLREKKSKRKPPKRTRSTELKDDSRGEMRRSNSDGDSKKENPTAPIDRAIMSMNNMMAADLKNNAKFKQRQSLNDEGPDYFEPKMKTPIPSEHDLSSRSQRKSFIKLPESEKSEASKQPPGTDISSNSSLKPELPARDAKPSVRKKKQQQQQQTNLVQIPEHGSPVIPPRDKSIKPAIPKRTVALPVVVTRNIDVHEQVRAFLISL